MLSLLNSPLGFASMPIKHVPTPAAPEVNPCTGSADPAAAKAPIWTAAANVECGGQDAAGKGGAVQSGADVTLGSMGNMTAGLQPITASYQSQGMCAAQPPNTFLASTVHKPTSERNGAGARSTCTGT